MDVVGRWGRMALVLAAACWISVPASAQLFGSSPSATQRPQTPADGAAVPPDVLTIPQLPVPPNSQFVIDDTVIVGDDHDWTGQVVISAPYSVIQMTQFFRTEMPRMGWAETAIVRARRTSISFVRDQRVATVRISVREEKRTEVDVVVSPSLAKFSQPSRGPASGMSAQPPAQRRN
ncbi:hypothetical protein [Arenibaculum pallidiluteum]|uniref:hypothetical protein n=1 Tax=Arenibaculum pallidiluteum TaxID=2812559 RepID=UPI001A96D422|nr:hypothetical protein [Arenibaculum pallidiluteum]